ncbi:hypothetical protein RJ640_001714 [Escallonia rubra]|uniref:Peptidase A1 domain-containing protein n=1 Tax=Escallonia rubra TaxID=112253 RepID=A0AA88QS37_9ASTE|nr:hypothetical protein RJ640_001714 [Escallonia rubra]
MAAKFTISSLLFLLLIACQNRPTSQLDILNLPPPGWCYGFLSYPASEWEYKRDVEVAIDLEAIVKALYDTGYKTASNIFEKDLGQILGVRYNLENATTVMGNTTIFVPRDDAFKNRSSIDFEPQIVRSLMLDREALHSSTLPVKTLFAIRGARDYLSVTQKPTDSHGHVSINNVTITDWDIYHNGRVVVHGVEDFFGPYFVFKNPPPNHEASVYCKILLLSFVVLASTYINAAATAATFAKPRRIVTKLIHRDSVHSPFYMANATASDHARLAIENSEARIASIHERIRNYGSMDDLGAKVIAADKGNIFFVNLYIGEPAVSQFVIMDTASSLLWVHCLPCKGCECWNWVLNPLWRSNFDSIFKWVPNHSLVRNKLIHVHLLE